MQKPVLSNTLNALLKDQDIALAISVLNKVNVKSYIDFLNKCDPKYDHCYKQLFNIAKKEYDSIPEDELEQRLTVGAMIKICYNILLDKNKNGFDTGTSVFIQKKLIIEPLIAHSRIERSTF